jgi:hypothetical protein
MDGQGHLLPAPSDSTLRISFHRSPQFFEVSPVGVMHGFTNHVAPHVDAHLILAGPTVHSVADDPEGQR